MSVQICGNNTYHWQIQTYCIFGIPVTCWPSNTPISAKGQYHLMCRPGPGQLSTSLCTNTGNK